MELSRRAFRIFVCFYATAAIALGASSTAPPIGSRRIWYTSPAPEWNLALPIGSGRLGGMVYGGIGLERVQMNEDSIWDGGFQDRVNPRAAEGFPIARELLLNESLTEAGQTVLATMSGNPISPRAYQPMVELFCEFEHPDEEVRNYSRWLDTYEGYVGSQYVYKDVEYNRTSFGSFPASVLALRFEANASAAINTTVTLFREHNATYHAAELGLPYSSIIIRAGSGQADGINFTAQARLYVEGNSANVSTNGTSVAIHNADTLTIFIDAETSYRYPTEQAWEAELNRKLDDVAAALYHDVEHDALNDYTELAHRVSLDLGSSGDIGLLPTIDRLRRWQNVTMGGDPELASLQFSLGRYMLITSSRKEYGIVSLPANLQGIWSQRYDPPWGGKYTVNINTEMNYWPAEVTNLAETHLPLFDLIEVIRPKGRDVAKKMYSCPGFMTHHNTDLWGDSAPVDNGTQWTMWPMGAPWLSLHLIEHYRFNGNKTWLANHALPVLQDAADFYYCYLFNHSGHYATGPSISPENSFRTDPDQVLPNATASIDIAPTMDNEILHELFAAIVEAGRALDISAADPSVAKAAHYLSHIAVPAISPALGTIQEWRRDYGEHAPGHRHVSHLFGLFPGRSISPSATPSLAGAANATLARRLAHGGAGTGWSRAWTIAWYARLRDGDAAWQHVAQFLNTSVNDNLFSNNPYPTFQCDGNFGFVAGVAEMLLQSHEEIGEGVGENGGGGWVVHLLPALPKGVADVQAGEVKGLVARGGFVVDMKWEGGRLMAASVVSRLGNVLALRVAGEEEGFKINGGVYSGPLKTAVGQNFTVTL